MERKKIIIVGCSISGGLCARKIFQLNPSVDLKIYEKMGENEINNHWTQPVNGAALNINPNGMTSIKKNDPLLYKKLIEMANPRLHIRAVSLNRYITEPLFSINMLEYSNDAGIIIRWNDIIKLLRNSLSINYDCDVLNYTYNNEKFFITIKSKDKVFVEKCDVLISSDGRFSKIRDLYQKPNIVQHNVVNFRLLVPNNLNYSFGDLTLYYNHQNCKLARIGVTLVSPTEFLNEESIYIFGNFRIDNNFDKSKFTKEEFKNLYYNDSLTENGKIILDIILSNFESIHWARFQSTDICLKSKYCNLFFIGDSAHAFPPSLGQGATLAIEDAFLVANSLFSSNVDLEKHLKRVEHIKNCSEVAAQHLINDDLDMEVRLWNNKTWLEKMQKIWCTEK